MQYRISDILLVSSLYDLYILEEDGRLYEMIQKEFQGLNLSHTPGIVHVSSGQEALELAASGHRFDLIITTLHIEDMHATRFAKMAHASSLNIPIVLLAYDNREQQELVESYDATVFDRIFIWQGDYRILVAIIKYVEDRINVENDTKAVGVQSILLVEDNVRYYSSFLPMIYNEVLNHSRSLISEGINVSDRYLRMRARPKILLASTFEEAWTYYEKYADDILGVISDVDFKHHGKHDPNAGVELTRLIKARHPDIPVLLQSNDISRQTAAHSIGASFLHKDSPTLLQELRTFMKVYFSFGDFVFRTPDGTEVGRASDLATLEQQLQILPEESIRYHAQRNHFSRWLKARTEFLLAHRLRPRKVSDYASTEDLRQDLFRSLQSYRRNRQLGQITDFSKQTFDPTSTIARIGGGSLGGKARGLGFVHSFLSNFDIREQFDGVEIFVPPAVIIGTEVFDEFLEKNGLRDFALRCTDDEEITKRFMEAKRFPKKVRDQLADFLTLVRDPLAVRSSSLLEDSQYHPFAGVYTTYMIPNLHKSLRHRLDELVDAIKRIYASTFYQGAKDYIKVTSYLHEDEKMAVIVQTMVGTRHENRFYPDFAGVAKSYNFYPLPPQKAEDGIVAAALGMGKTIVEGGNSVRFCPKYPNHLLQFYSTQEALRNNQSEFFALELNDDGREDDGNPDIRIVKCNLATAERDGVLGNLASTYSVENDTIHDGISREGRRVVTFAPILRNKIFPLPAITELLLDMGTWGMGTPVELEFAVKMSVRSGARKEFCILQMRPLVLNREAEELHVEEVERDRILCSSDQTLGNGVFRNIRDVVAVDADRFDRSRTNDIALEISQLNQKLINERRRYLLIGLGRWGSADPWLGIPVKWEQISGAEMIVESGFKDMEVAPSQGSHFFQNITSFMIGYLSVDLFMKKGFVDWQWLAQQAAMEEKQFVRHLRFEEPLDARINGKLGKGVILKPPALNERTSPKGTGQ
ncbi:MAG: histidine kinase [Ignavibacteriales bacterium]|nr:histidine kinase [Ignavibacteriales bacterium]